MKLKTILLTLLANFSMAGFATNISEMTLEEKVGQLLMVHFTGEQANEEAQALIQKVHVGGIIYYNWANGLYSPEQVLNLSKGLQKLASQNRNPIPLLIATDQEGGVVARLTKGFTIFPGNKALGITGKEELAEQSAFAMGQELRAVGINFNLAPVVDVNSNPRNPIIGVRAFGDTTDVVIPFANRAVRGYHKAGIIISLKHFPGHGDVEVDSHQDLPIINKNKQQLQKVELLPFSELAGQADTIMTAHVMVPSIDPVNCATLSSELLNILRKEIGYNGVIITDSLVMEGLLKNCASVDDAAIRAFNAGCDIILLGGKQISGAHVNLELTVSDVERVHQSLVNAVKSGRITSDRLEEAVQRILALKSKYDLKINKQDEDLKPVVNSSEHQVLAKKIASLALRVTESENNKHFAPIQNHEVVVIAPKLVQGAINETSLLKLGKKTHTLFFSELNPSDEEIEAANQLAKEADVVIFCSYNAWKNQAQGYLVESLAKHNKPTIIIALRETTHSTLLSGDLVITTFSPTTPSIQAASAFIENFGKR
jgi:beta-N-acetylhexosaminidase